MTDSQLGRLRMRAGHNQRQAAALLGKHQTQLSDYERGEYPPDRTTAARLAELYGVAIARIMRAAEADGIRYARRLRSCRVRS